MKLDNIIRNLWKYLGIAFNLMHSNWYQCQYFIFLRIALVDGTFYTNCWNTPVQFPFRNATNCMNKRLLLLSLSVGCTDWKEFKTSIDLVKYQFKPITYLLLKVFSFVMASNTTTPKLDQFCTCSSSLPWKYSWVKQDTTKRNSILMCE